MDLEDVSNHGDHCGPAEAMHGRTDLVGRREPISSNQQLGAVLKVAIRGNFH
jgi:hypothetical protein